MSTPRASRPSFPSGYGISQEADGLLPWEWAVERLTAARNYWIGTTRADGRPHSAPVWGLWHDGALLFSTSPDSVKGRNVARDPRVTVHLDSGEEVVILDGEIEPVAIDQSVADLYEAKYAFRPDPSDPLGVWFKFRPRSALAWLEREYVQSATRYHFDL